MLLQVEVWLQVLSLLWDMELRLRSGPVQVETGAVPGRAIALTELTLRDTDEHQKMGTGRGAWFSAI